MANESFMMQESSNEEKSLSFHLSKNEYMSNNQHILGFQIRLITSVAYRTVLVGLATVRSWRHLDS